LADNLLAEAHRPRDIKDEMLRAQLLRELHELNECQKAEEKRWIAEQGWENP
jgi:hypothetical protein